MSVASVQLEITRSLIKARVKRAAMHSPHEGYAILLEEVDELWEEVKRWQPGFANRAEMRKEALHVAAMALEFVVEVCDGETGGGDAEVLP